MSHLLKTLSPAFGGLVVEKGNYSCNGILSLGTSIINILYSVISLLATNVQVLNLLVYNNYKFVCIHCPPLGSVNVHPRLELL